MDFAFVHSKLSGDYQWVKVFTALHAMQTRSSDENSVCPSVCHTRVL